MDEVILFLPRAHASYPVMDAPYGAGDIIARRWPAASRHVAYVTIPCQERGQFKIAATVILSDVVMTFYHKVYSNKEKTSWCWPPDIGTSVTVSVPRSILL